MKDPQAFFDELQGPKYKLKLKGVAAPSYHLGGDFSRDSDGTYAWGAKTHVWPTIYVRREAPDGLPAHMAIPEVDTSDFHETTRQYMSLLGALQWAISLCRFDIATAVMTLGRFRVAPRVGHMDRETCLRVLQYPTLRFVFVLNPNFDDRDRARLDVLRGGGELPTGPTLGKPFVFLVR
jgi:hypothetical protein